MQKHADPQYGFNAISHSVTFPFIAFGYAPPAKQVILFPKGAYRFLKFYAPYQFSERFLLFAIVSWLGFNSYALA